MGRVAYFVVCLSMFLFVIFVTNTASASQVLHLTWDHVTTTTDGQLIPPDDIEYVLYGRINDRNFDVFTIVTDNEWLGPVLPPGCYEFFLKARRIVSRLESEPSNTVGECIYAEDGSVPEDQGEVVKPVQPTDVDRHSPPVPPRARVMKLDVDW